MTRPLRSKKHLLMCATLALAPDLALSQYGLLGQETNVLFAAACPSDEQHGTYNMIRAQ
jgi:hypothetical protein